MRLSTKQRLDYYLGVCLIGLLKPLAVALGWLLRRDHATAMRGPVAVIKMQGGGSLVLAAPALHGIRARYPAQPLLLVTTPAMRPFGESLQLFDEILCVDDRSLWQLMASSLGLLWRLRGTDTILDLEVYSRLTGVFALCTLARNRIGFFLDHTFWRRGIYTHLMFFNRQHPVAFFYERLARLLDAQAVGREVVAQRMGLVRTHLLDRAESAEVIAIGAGCSDMSVERRMAPAGWVHFLRPVISTTPAAEFVWLGSGDDWPVAEAIIAALREQVGPGRYVNACGTLPLSASLQLLCGASAYYGIDSALLHYARVAGVPSTSFWGPVSPSQMLTPWPDVHDTVHYEPIPCSPCVHVAETPPCRGDNLCIQRLYDRTVQLELAARLDRHPPWSGQR